MDHLKRMKSLNLRSNYSIVKYYAVYNIVIFYLCGSLHYIILTIVKEIIMFRVRQTNMLADSPAKFLDEIIPQKDMTPQLVTIDSASDCAYVADDSLYMQRRRRTRRSRVGVNTSAVRTGWY